MRTIVVEKRESGHALRYDKNGNLLAIGRLYTLMLQANDSATPVAHVVDEGTFEKASIGDAVSVRLEFAES